MIDFFLVESHHRKIDARLVNWARWVKDRPASRVHPMWRGFKASEVWAHHEIVVPVDGIDGQAIEKHVGALPERNRDSIRWAYVYRIHPSRFCRSIGVNPLGLSVLIYDGRQMLINRLTM